MSSRIVGARTIVPRARVTPTPPNPYLLPQGEPPVGLSEMVMDRPQQTNNFENLGAANLPAALALAVRIP